MLALATQESTKSKMITNAKGVEMGMSHTYIDRKSYGIRHGLKGSALEKAHKEYRRTLGLSMNSAVSVLLSQGKVLAQSWKPTAGGGLTVTFVNPAKVEYVEKKEKSVVTEAEALKALAKSRGMSVEDLEVLLG